MTIYYYIGIRIRKIAKMTNEEEISNMMIVYN